MLRMLLPVFIVAILGAVAMYFLNHFFGPIPTWVMVLIGVGSLVLIGGLPYILARPPKK